MTGRRGKLGEFNTVINDQRVTRIVSDSLTDKQHDSYQWADDTQNCHFEQGGYHTTIEKEGPPTECFALSLPKQTDTRKLAIQVDMNLIGDNGESVLEILMKKDMAFRLMVSRN